MDKKTFFTYSSLALYNNEIFFIPHYGGVLNKISIVTGEVKNCGNFIDEDESFLSHRKVLAVDDELYLIPYNSQSLIKYHVESGEYRTFSIPDEIINVVSGKPMFFGAYKDENFIYMFGFKPIILRFDYKSIEFKMINISEFHLAFEPKSWFRSECNKVGNCLFVPFYQYNYAVRIHGDNTEVVEICVNDEYKHHNSMLFDYNDGLCYVRQSDEGRVMIDLFDRGLNLKPYKSYCFDIQCKPTLNSEETCFLTGKIIRDSLVFFPGYSDDYCIIDLSDSNSELKVIQKLSEKKRSLYNNSGWSYLDSVCDDDAIYSLLRETGELSVFKNEKISSIGLFIDGSEKKRYLQRTIERGSRTIVEDPFMMTFNDFIYIVSDDNT